MREIIRANYSDDTQVRRRIAPRAAIVFEAIRREGREELEAATPGLTRTALAAGFIFVGGLQYTPVFQGEMQETLTIIGPETISGSFWAMLFGAILAGK